jgi:wyosine [tRNA(Phe)-imidazoG37] synthetase (radical SAM superfamily)
MIAFGPIPSRRLGQSLGINTIPLKNCSYDCVYCQVGPTSFDDFKRRRFYPPEKIFQAVEKRVQEVRSAGAQIDYLSIVPDGEPSLDINLGTIIQRLRSLNVKIAVISNSSLLWQDSVRKELALADLVSLKIDTVDQLSWRKINRPNPRLSLREILAGALAFSKTFQGTLITESMLVQGINDQEAALQATANYLGQLNPDTAYIAIPTRPPTEKKIQSPDESTLNLAYQLFNQQVRKAECLTGFSTDTFSASGDVVENILNITAVHPIRESEVLNLLKRGNADAKKLEELVKQGQLVRVFHEGLPFYVRKYALVK